jgi:competence protein ComEC
VPPRVSLAAPVPLLCLVFVLTTAAVAGAFGSFPDGQRLGFIVAASAGAGIATTLARRRAPAAGLLIALTIGFGLWRSGAAFGSQSQPWDAAPTERIRAIAAVEDVAEQGSRAAVTVRLEQILAPEGIVPPTGKVRLTTRAMSAIEAGDRIEISGRIDPVRPADRSGEGLLRRGIVAVMAYPNIIPNGHVAQSPVDQGLRTARAAIERAIDAALPEPEASLLAGLLVGSDQGAPEGFRQALVASGTTHIVVVSGYNITLVAGVLAAVVRSRAAWSLATPLLGLWLFALLAGGGAPTLRAAIMATAYLLVRWTGRAADALLALALAATMMIAIDPTLVTDLSFQLSSLATLGLITLQPRVVVLLRWLPAWIRDPLACTLAAELVTLPIIAQTFHQVSVVSPISNILVAPLIPLATIAGAIGAALILLSPFTSSLVGPLLMLPCGAIVGIIEGAAQLPSPTAPVGEISGTAIALYGLGLLAWAAGPTPEGRDLWNWARSTPAMRSALLAVSAAGTVAGIAAWSQTTTAPGPMVVTVLDVGQGDAVFARTPRGKTILIDGGPNPSALLNGVGRRMGIAEHTLSIAALTRADAEHLPGLVAGIERYPAELYLSPADLGVSSLGARWRTLASTGRAITVDRAMTLAIEPDVILDVYPTTALPAGSGPDGAPLRTLLARLRYGSVGVLIAPTATSTEIIQAAAAGWPVESSVLVVPRHGVADAVDPGLLAAVRPSMAVISVAARNRLDAPARSTLDTLRDINVFRTDLHGDVEIRTDGSTLSVYAEHGIR